MSSLTQFLENHVLAAVAVAMGIGLAIRHFVSQGRAPRLSTAMLSSIGLVLFAVGSFLLSGDVGMWLSAGATAVLFLACLLLLISGNWSYYVGLAVAAGLALGLGGWLESLASREVYYGVRLLRHGEIGSPWWLLTLLAAPLVVWLSFHSLAGLGPVRRWVAIGLRCFLVALLALALAELRLRKPSDNLTVLYLVDRSLSIPEEFDGSETNPIDLRWKRFKDFIAAAVQRRGSGHELDQSGVIVFGRRPRLALPPSTAPLSLTDELAGSVDKYYTDVGAAIKLALASFPEGASKRIVLVSDGNENLGNVEEQVRLARLNNVQIDVVTVAAGQKNESEVLVQSVEAPPLTETGTRLPIRALIRSHNPRPVRGTLQLRQKASEQVVKDGKVEVISTTTLVPIVPGSGVEQAGLTSIVVLRPGLNSFSFRQTLAGDKQSYTYEAVFQPTGVANDEGEWTKNVPGDRPQNNSASTHVVALGQRKVLFVEQDGKAGQHQLLLGQLQRSGKSKFKIAPVTTSELPKKKEDLGVFLSNFDCVVLANVPAEQLTNDQMEMLRSNTYDQGCGFVMIGGPDSFGAGGWQDTPVEKALPVDCDIKSLKVAGKGGLVLTFHASEIAEGNRWQKEIGKLAVRKLAPIDMVGVNYWSFGTKWHVKFQQVGGNKSDILQKIDKMTPEDMPDCNPALSDAYDELTNPRHGLATKHIIFISDGDHWVAQKALLARMKAAGVTCTTVCITSHGQLERTKMKEVADLTGGRFYAPTDASKLPAIYIQETRIVSQAFIHEKAFLPKLHQTGGPAATLPGELPPLHGFIRTTKKPSALASMPIEGPSAGDQEFPVLAYWYYGLGKAVAFTSDARTGGADGKQYWDRDWAQSDLYLKFWEQVIGWALRSVETGKLAMVTEYRDGKIKVTVDARDENKKPITNLKLEGAVTSPNPEANGGKPIVLDFKQKNAGQYEAEFKAEEAGSYFLNANAKQTVTEVRDGKEVLVEKTVDGVRSGVTIPYSPEFADLESNLALLRKIAEMTGGNVYSETDANLKSIEAAGTIYRMAPANARSLQPVWFWLVLCAGIALLFDVAVRRIAIEPAAATTALANGWEALRGRREAIVRTPEFIERLKSRKAEVGDTLAKGKARRRFEDESASAAPAPPGADDVAALPKPAPRPRPVDEQEEAAGEDYAARLMKAKRKAMEDKDKKKPEG